MQNLPIGIFDSGIGGLTVTNILKEKLPKESIIYFGDTEHLPYGEKSYEAIQYFSKKITEFLKKKHCKVIIIACNSASSVAFDIVQKEAENIPVFNVIDPVVNEVTKNYAYCNIGVIGTKATIQSGVYTKKIREICTSVKVSEMATPLLVPMIEEGFVNGDISHKIIENYLSNKMLSNIDSLILACTHYPLIYREIDDFYQNKTNVIDSADIVANFIHSELKNLNLLNDGNNPESHFYISNYTRNFEKSAQFFFQEDINIEEANIWI